MIRFRALFFLLAPFATFAAPLCPSNPSSHSACAGWEALQQIRSLIPERNWEQEFDVLIDRKGFRKALSHWNRSKKFSPTFTTSRKFFLKSTFAGENIRIFDRYEEFAFSPFWKYPPRLRNLRSLEAQVLKESRP